MCCITVKKEPGRFPSSALFLFNQLTETTVPYWQLQMSALQAGALLFSPYLKASRS